LHGVGVEINVGFLAMRPISSSGWTVPSSLLACMMVMSTVPDGREAQFVKIDQSSAIGRQIGDADTFFFKGLAGVEDGFGSRAVVMMWEVRLRK